MSLIFLLDTNVLSELTKPQPNPGVLSSLTKHQGTMALPSLVWHEILYGIEKLQEGKRKRALTRFTRDVVAPFFPILSYDDTCASIQARIRVQLEPLGITVPFVDSMIASIALAHNLVLVTRNTLDFEAIPNLVLENWFQE